MILFSIRAWIARRREAKKTCENGYHVIVYDGWDPYHVYVCYKCSRCDWHTMLSLHEIPSDWPME